MASEGLPLVRLRAMEPVFVALMVLVLLAGAGLCAWAVARLARGASTGDR